ncbi:hypothetical protein LCGC14_1497450 [marine sediment metagenome]|uniref:Uncharacterized protein n=1 Tax=marine sediment metagenome TaxID=412755 RepID=A0A0F9M6L0_9ZZZZ
MSYREWFYHVDHCLLGRASIVASDIDVNDYDFKDAYMRGKSPKRAAIESLFNVDLDNEI